MWPKFSGFFYKLLGFCFIPSTSMENVIPIEDIREGMTHWTARITVQEKLQATQGFHSPTRYQKFVFVDEKGSRVQGILFNDEIEKMGPKIEVCKTYLVSNARVRNIQEKYQVEGVTMQWVMSSRTVIEEVRSDKDVMILPFTYTSFKDFVQHIDQKNSSIDILAVIIHALPTKTFNKDGQEIAFQKFVIINEEMQPVMLTMWGDFATKEGCQIVEALHKLPIVICRRIKVVCFDGVSLSTRIDSAILIDPPVLEARQLKIWAKRNEKELANIVDGRAYDKYNPQLSIKQDQKFILIANVLSTHKHAWVKAMLSFENISQKYWYMACKKCSRSTDASYGYVFSCNSCTEKQTAEPRCCVDVDLTDQSGTIVATVFGELAEKLLTFSALQAMQHFQQMKELSLQDVHKELKSKIFAAQIKPGKSKLSDGQQRFSLIYFYEISADQPLLQLTVDDSPQEFSHDSLTKLDKANTPIQGESSSKVKTSLAKKFGMLEEVAHTDLHVADSIVSKKAKMT